MLSVSTSMSEGLMRCSIYRLGPFSCQRVSLTLLTLSPSRSLAFCVADNNKKNCVDDKRQG